MGIGASVKLSSVILDSGEKMAGRKKKAIVAKYWGTCVLCSAGIWPGQKIVKYYLDWTSGWAHEECAEIEDRYRPRS